MLGRGSEMEGTLLTVMRGRRRACWASRVLGSASGDDGWSDTHRHCKHTYKTIAYYGVDRPAIPKVRYSETPPRLGNRDKVINRVRNWVRVRVSVRV